MTSAMLRAFPMEAMVASHVGNFERRAHRCRGRLLQTHGERAHIDAPQGRRELIFQVVHLGGGQTLALRAIHGHCVIEAVPMIIEWRRNSPYTKYCNLGSIVEHGMLSRRAIDPGRSDIFFSAAVTPVTINRYRADGDFHDFWCDVDPDNSDHDNPTTRESDKLDSELVVVKDTQIAMCSGCKLFIIDSRAIVRKGDGGQSRLDTRRLSSMASRHHRPKLTLTEADGA